MEVAALVISAITLLIALSIHSETREIFGHVNLIARTLPGAHDVRRCVDDMERSKEKRAIVVCDAPKNTHIAYSIPAPSISRIRRMKNASWEGIRKLSSCWSGDIVDETIIQESEIGKWEIKSSAQGSQELSKLLSGGWEPFSVTTDNRIWVRKHSN